MLPLLAVALAFPGWPASWRMGLLVLGAGATMIALPPRRRLPGLWWMLAGGVVVSSLLGFLPLGGGGAWRRELAELGVPVGGGGYVQPGLAFEHWLLMGVTLVLGAYLVGHRVESALRLRLICAWAAMVALLVGVAMILHEEGRVFGFSADGDGMAALLAMGTVGALGALVQGIRARAPGWIGVAAAAAVLPVVAMLGFTETRTGLLLAALGLLASVWLTGFRYMKGNTVKAVGLVVLCGVGWLLIQGSMREQDPDLAEEVVDFDEGADRGGEAWEEATVPGGFEGRMKLYRDTLGLIGGEPWTGVGPGQFRHVFPQYREEVPAPGEAVYAHPASDWLAAVAETGLLSALALAGLVGVVAGHALSRSRNANARAVTVGGLVAALMVPLYGLVAGPGQQAGLVWSALWLLAVCLPSDGKKGRRREGEEAPEWQQGAWRGAGGVLVATGLVLLGGDLLGRPALPSERAKSLLKQARAWESGELPSASEQEARMKAFAAWEGASALMPMDPHPRAEMARLALATGGETEGARADAEFEIERRLRPRSVDVPLRQAAAYLPGHPERAEALLPEVMARAEREVAAGALEPEALMGVYAKLLGLSGQREASWELTLELAGTHPERVLLWVSLAPTGVLEARMPEVIRAVPDPTGRQVLLEQWKLRDPNGVAEAFSRTHAELFPAVEAGEAE